MQSIQLVKTQRLQTSREEKFLSLSLVDATVANFPVSGLALAYPGTPSHESNFDKLQHALYESLYRTTQAYPHWVGRIKSVDNLDGLVPLGAEHLPPHARRFGRLYIHYGTQDDPGVEFQWAKSSATLEALHPPARMVQQPLWDRSDGDFEPFASPTPIANPLEPHSRTDDGLLLPLLSIRITQLACGGLVIAAKSSHVVADMGTLSTFLKDWASLCRAQLSGDIKSLPLRLYDSNIVDSRAAGDINAPSPGPKILQRARVLPRHRYDMWASASGCPWEIKIPPAFDNDRLKPVGKVVPWDEMDTTAKVSTYVIHFTKQQVKLLWSEASKLVSIKDVRLSQHDVLLAHVWSRMASAREQAGENDMIYCDVVFSLRAALDLGPRSLGCPIGMMNVELPRSLVADPGQMTTVAKAIRKTLLCVRDVENISANLHDIAYATSPSRIAEYFTGRRHVVLTTWAHFGVYDIDFGLGTCAYVEPILPDCDGMLAIKGAPRVPSSERRGLSSHWAADGVDVTISLMPDVMKRFLSDPLLLPVSQVQRPDRAYGSDRGAASHVVKGAA
ncbi:transferase family protein [Sarocladium implicatum]|nr:transferase family protein [Sarocladium implicatum]